MYTYTRPATPMVYYIDRGSTYYRDRVYAIVSHARYQHGPTDLRWRTPRVAAQQRARFFNLTIVRF